MIDKTPTNCIGKCRGHPLLHYCLGCWRTFEQIANWKSYTQEEKEKILTSKTYKFINDDRDASFYK